MQRYILRYFFDPGSGIRLWSANDTASEKFDYPVQLHDLWLPENLLRKAIYVMAWYDTSLDCKRQFLLLLAQLGETPVWLFRKCKDDCSD